LTPALSAELFDVEQDTQAGAAAPPTGAAEGRPLIVNTSVLELVVGVALLAMAAWFIWQSTLLPADRNAVGPAAFPLAVAILLAALVLVLLGSAARRITQGATTTFRRPLAVLGAMALVIAFPTLMDVFGYYGTAAVWLLAFGWLAHVRRPLLLGATMVGMLLFARIVFEMLLGTPLP
jgi:hypothetical protein